MSMATQNNNGQSSIGHFIQWMEQGKIPDFVIRMGIRRLLKTRLLQMKNEVNGQLSHYLANYVQQLKSSPLAILTDVANQQHYEVPTEYFHLSLGAHKKYSSCYWTDEMLTLEQAEQKSLDLSIEHAQIQNGMAVLELGCGWGSLSLELARRFPDSKITSVSNSRTQKLYIDEQARLRGLSNLTVLTRDLSKEESYDFGETKYDRVMSIEMMEHLRNYEKFFSLVSKSMKKEAKFFIHIFTHKTTPYFFETEGEDNWMGKYFFSGGQMPSRDLFDQFDKDLRVEQKWDWNGQHYQKTLEAWLHKMDQNEEVIRELFAQAYGQHQVETWINRWRVFYMACAELFGYNKGEEWGVTHYLMSRKI